MGARLDNQNLLLDLKKKKNEQESFAQLNECEYSLTTNVFIFILLNLKTQIIHLCSFKHKDLNFRKTFFDM